MTGNSFGDIILFQAGSHFKEWQVAKMNLLLKKTLILEKKSILGIQE